MTHNQYIRFDWAAKYMLRNKADFAIFEGLISVLVGEKVSIVELLESEANQEFRGDKFNRVDIKARNSNGDIILVEIQQTRERDYLERMIYGVAKAITEHIGSGQSYANVKKVYSINIIYFDLGEGADYLYHGQANLIGVHTHDVLQLTPHERDDLNIVQPKDAFPEYFVIRVNEFNQMAVSPLEEWLQYLKDEYIRPDTTVPGLKEARKRLEYLRMTPEQRRQYDHYIDTMVRDQDVYTTQLMEQEIAIRKASAEGEAKGHAEGLIEGEAKGRAEGLAEGEAKGEAKGRALERIGMVSRMKAKGLSPEDIAELTGFSLEEVQTM